MVVELSKLYHERSQLDAYVSGFTDAEGCFSVSLKRQAGTRFGFVLDPVFSVTQDASQREVLETLEKRLGCGRIIPKPGQPQTLQFLVDNRRQLLERVIPFYDHRLVVKAQDFERFSIIVHGLEEKQHGSRGGFERLLRIAFSMNMNGKQRRYQLETIIKELESADPQRLYAKHRGIGDDIVRHSQ